MSDLDPMDARLREYADRWRTSSAPAPAFDTDRLTGHSRSRTWWAAGIAAAAVIAGITLGTTLVGHDDVAGPRPPKPADTSAPSDVVPWAPLPATHPQIPTTTTTPSPDPAEAAGKPACRASDLRATSTGGGAAGTYYRTVRLTVVGTETCTVTGYPEVRLLDQGRPVDIPLARWRDANSYQDPVLVSPGHPARLQLSWGANWCAPPVHNDTIHLVLPGGVLTLDGMGDSSCYGTPGSGTKEPIYVHSFEPLKWHEGTARSAYADVDVSGDLDLTASSEDSVPFAITLTSPKDLPLEPCPDYRILQTGSIGPQTESYALNCSAVPFKDDHGHPYLPAGTPVRFAMTTASHGPGTYKLSWVLDTVDERGVSGTLTVAPRATPAGSATAVPLGPAEAKTVQSAVAAIQTFLDTWRRDGMVVAARRYFDAGSQPQSAAGLPRISSGKVLHADVSSWESPDRFVLEVQLDLHFTANRFAWDEGRNDRFITVTRDGAGFRLDFATSP